VLVLQHSDSIGAPGHLPARGNAHKRDDPRLIGSSVPISRRAIWRPSRARRRDTIQQRRSGRLPTRPWSRCGAEATGGRFPHAPATRSAPHGLKNQPVWFSLSEVVCARFGAGSLIRPSAGRQYIRMMSAAGSTMMGTGGLLSAVARYRSSDHGGLPVEASCGGRTK
jgi:hypothetical protein